MKLVQAGRWTSTLCILNRPYQATQRGICTSWQDEAQINKTVTGRFHYETAGMRRLALRFLHTHLPFSSLSSGHLARYILEAHPRHPPHPTLFCLQLHPNSLSYWWDKMLERFWPTETWRPLTVAASKGSFLYRDEEKNITSRPKCWQNNQCFPDVCTKLWTYEQKNKNHHTRPQSIPVERLEMLYCRPWLEGSIYMKQSIWSPSMEQKSVVQIQKEVLWCEVKGMCWSLGGGGWWGCRGHCMIGHVSIDGPSSSSQRAAAHRVFVLIL